MVVYAKNMTADVDLAGDRRGNQGCAAFLQEVDRRRASAVRVSNLAVF